MNRIVTTTPTHYNKIRSANAVAVSSAPYHRSIRTNDFNPTYFRAMSATIETPIMPVSSHTEMTTAKPKTTLRFTSDPILLAMSDDEYIAALEALGGSVVNGEVDESIDEMNAIWRDKLGEIYDAVNSPDTHP